MQSGPGEPRKAHRSSKTLGQQASQPSLERSGIRTNRDAGELTRAVLGASGHVAGLPVRSQPRHKRGLAATFGRRRRTGNTGLDTLRKGTRRRRRRTPEPKEEPRTLKGTRGGEQAEGRSQKLPAWCNKSPSKERGAGHLSKDEAADQIGPGAPRLRTGKAKACKRAPGAAGKESYLI